MARWMVLTMLGAAMLRADPRGADLLGRLTARQPVSVVCYGDSVTQGMHLEQPGTDAVPALFSRIMTDSYPGLPLQLTAIGMPGASTSAALEDFDAKVKRHQPHLVVLQFGGNDKGTGPGTERVQGYRENLLKLIDTCHEAGAAVIVMTPPMAEPERDMPFPVATRETAAVAGVPCADADTALKRREFDYRGFFPYFTHPGQHDHETLAIELYRAFRELIGRPPQLRLGLPDVVTRAALGSLVQAPVQVSWGGNQGVSVTLYADGSLSPEQTIELPPHGKASLDVTLGVPHTLSGGRSDEWPLWLHAAAGEDHAFALARAALVPRVNVPAARTDEARLPLARLRAPSLTLGRGTWSGDADLSAEVRVTYDALAVHLAVAVTDDLVRADEGPPYGDGVELYLDLRPDGDRGKPFFGRQCASLFLGLTAKGAGAKVSTPNEDDPPKALLELKPRSTLNGHGYVLEVDLPRRLGELCLEDRTAAVMVRLTVF
ncbi:MAG: hypothetical protein HYU66_05065 [Armatimonadetes bacterium]|nr:hypothetical protein [Armatimonadota bacterium]